jgi:hypothetical protein
VERHEGKTEGDMNIEETLMVVVREDEQRELIIKMSTHAQYEILETIEAFNRMTGLPTIEEECKHLYITKELKRWRRRFHRSAA